MVKRIITLFVLLGVFCLASACSKKNKTVSSDKIKVVSTTAMIAEIVEHIAKDKIESVCLIKGDIDPHSYELVKGDQAKLSSANCIFYQGLGLEHGASLISYLKSNPKALAVGEVLQNNYADQLIYHDGYLDPHVWLDIDLWQKIIPAITTKLSEVDPANASFYEANAQELKIKMTELDSSIQNLLNDIPESKRYLVTAHSAFSYFARRYLAHEGAWLDRHIAPEGLAPEAQISLYDIEKVVSYIQSHGVDIIFSESNVSKEAIHKIMDVCAKSGISIKLASKPLFGDALFDEKGYLDMMWHNATLLHQAWNEQNQTNSQN